MSQVPNDDFESLNPEDQARIFSKSPLREKADLILHSHDPIKLTSSVSGEELYLITREMDVEERSEILRYANMPQIVFIGDIDCWEKDMISKTGFVRWLEILMLADENKLLIWMLQIDVETLVTGLQKIMFVMKPEWEYAVDEVLGDKPYFTLDYLYYISVDEDNYQTIKRSIEILFECDKKKYFAVVEAIMSESEYEVEEEAYRRRSMRLAGRGFPDLESAQSIYIPASMEDYKKMPQKNAHRKRAEGESAASPAAPVLWSGQKLFLDEVFLALQERDAEAMDGIYEELAWLSNKIIVCNGMDFSNEQLVLDGIDQARSILSLGLEVLSDSDIYKAAEILSHRWLEIIFRHGFYYLYELRRGAEGILREYWAQDKAAFLDFIGDPYEHIFMGLFYRVPLCYDESVTKDIHHLRFFSSPTDLTRARLAVSQIRAIHVFLEGQLGSVEHPDPEMAVLNHANPMWQLLGTVYAGFVVRGTVSRKALNQRELNVFLKKGFESKGRGRVLAPGPRKEFLEKFFPDADVSSVGTLWGIALHALQDDFARIDLSGTMDPRFISSVCVVESVKPKPRKPKTHS